MKTINRTVITIPLLNDSAFRLTYAGLRQQIKEIYKWLLQKIRH